MPGHDTSSVVDWSGRCLSYLSNTCVHLGLCHVSYALVLFLDDVTVRLSTITHAHTPLHHGHRSLSFARSAFASKGCSLRSLVHHNHQHSVSTTGPPQTDPTNRPSPKKEGGYKVPVLAFLNSPPPPCTKTRYQERANTFICPSTHTHNKTPTKRQTGCQIKAGRWHNHPATRTTPPWADCPQMHPGMSPQTVPWRRPVESGTRGTKHPPLSPLVSRSISSECSVFRP